MARAIKQSVTTTPDFHAAVEDYRKQHGIKTWAEAITILAAKALAWQSPPTPQHGGKRLGAGRKTKSL